MQLKACHFIWKRETVIKCKSLVLVNYLNHSQKRVKTGWKWCVPPSLQISNLCPHAMTLTSSLSHPAAIPLLGFLTGSPEMCREQSDCSVQQLSGSRGTDLTQTNKKKKIQEKQVGERSILHTVREQSRQLEQQWRDSVRSWTSSSEGEKAINLLLGTREVETNTNMRPR